MNEIDPLEKELQSLTLRRPSPEIGRRLFEGERKAALARAHVWNWLTPVAACALTALVVVRGPMRWATDFDPATNAPAITTVMYDPEASNTPRMFVLSRADINVELNAWPHLGPWHPAIRAPRAVPMTNRAGLGAEL